MAIYTKKFISDRLKSGSGQAGFSLSEKARQSLKLNLNKKDLPTTEARGKVVEMLAYKDDENRRGVYKGLKLSQNEINKIENRIKNSIGPDKEQISVLYKKIGEKGYNTKNIKDLIDSHIPKKEALTSTKINDIVKKVIRIQNIKKFARDMSDNRNGENKIHDLTTDSNGVRRGMADLNIEDIHKGSLVSMSQQHGNVNLGGRVGSAKEQSRSMGGNVIQGNFGSQKALNRMGTAPIGFRKAS